MAIVAGRTGHGKSAVIYNLLVNWLETNPEDTFLLVSYEIPHESILLRLLSILTRKHGSQGWTYNDIMKCLQGGEETLSPGLDIRELHTAIEILQSFEDRLKVIYQPDWNLDQLIAYCRDLRARIDRLDGILVDYLQLINPAESTYEDREMEVAIVARKLKRLAVNQNVPLVAAAQITQEAARLLDVIPPGPLEDKYVLEAIAKRRPQLHHLGHGAGEQEADLVLGLLNYQADFFAAREQDSHDPRLYRETGSGGPFEIGAIKNRHGQLGAASLVLEAAAGYIRDPGVFGR